LVDWNVVPGSTKMWIQEHVVLGQITFTPEVCLKSLLVFSLI